MMPAVLASSKSDTSELQLIPDSADFLVLCSDTERLTLKKIKIKNKITNLNGLHLNVCMLQNGRASDESLTLESEVHYK